MKEEIDLFVLSFKINKKAIHFFLIGTRDFYKHAVETIHFQTKDIAVDGISSKIN